ncbi:hypothetical protein [Candidatus Methylopumilus universalis]|uniref:hypothetical protein n=1 Tax=Candidatus Methylopumilus universalis TaxID=2588536 RepID=UPI003BEEC3CD
MKIAIACPVYEGLSNATFPAQHIETGEYSYIESFCYKISLKLPIGGEILILSDKPSID